MTRGHGGNLRELAAKTGRLVEDILDFSASINPLGPPEYLRPVISRAVEAVVHYPDPECTALAEAIARHHGISPDEVIVGNGSTEILCALPRALAAARALIPVPSYADYRTAPEQAGQAIEELRLEESAGFALDFKELGSRLQGGELVFLGQPNNPTGLLFDAAAFRELVTLHRETIFIVDEAFANFVDGYQSLIAERPVNVVVVRSMTKFYSIPGLRLGYAIADAEVAARVRRLIPPWSVNVFAQAVGLAVLSDEAYARATRAYVHRERERLASEIRQLTGFTVYPGRANFLMLRIDRAGLDAAKLAERLLQDGIAIRVCENFSGLDHRFFRVAVRTEAENDRLIRALASALGTPRPVSRKRRAATLMLQGTSSNAGKSVLAAALCRILLQDGVRVAPFKAQNMSLNSFVTADGGEMGRAQVMQAQACRIEPDVRMNPILLKPSSDTGSQVIVLGKPVANMNVQAYTDYKARVFETVTEAFDSLAGEYDAIVLEGAGSPAEVNLKHHDIVNMKMARHAEAPVLLVGDIDRGGVYASFVGTMEVLAEWERRLIAGFIVNRFRGDASLLASAHDYVLRHTGRPVLGVVPYLSRLNLPEEDSVEFKSGALDASPPDGEAVEIAVIDLPHISNFTDFDALRLEPDVHLRIVRSRGELGQPDAVIVPGSKNVIGDIQYLRDSGLAELVLRLAETGRCEMVGVCAGFQILGREIADPHRIESAAGRASGLGLLPVTTTLATEKTLTRASGTHLPSGLAVHGYEIHHGQTSADGLVPIIRSADSRLIGAARPDGRVWGTYLHGVFDADAFRRWFIDRLRERRGLPPLGRCVAAYDLEPALDRLADVVRSSVDLKRIYELMRIA